jgi:hypothetical protein
MKYLFALALLSAGFMISVEAGKKYICVQENMEDSDFSSTFRTAEECKKYCSGISVCQETDESTAVSESETLG